MSGADLARRDVARAVAPPAYGRWLASALMVAVAAWFAWIVATNPNFEWPVVAKWFTAAAILRGLAVSLGLTVVAMAIGVALGLLLAVARLSPSRPLHTGAALYIWFFRGTPLLVQLLFWYNLSTLFPTVAIGIPFGPNFAVWNTNDLISPVTAAIAGLGLNEAAYMAEIIRGGLLSVPRGQAETAQAFGMTHARALRRIILPQAIRRMIPAFTNRAVELAKSTSIASVLEVPELMYQARELSSATFLPLETFAVVSVIYFLLIYPVTWASSVLERRLAVGGV